MPLPKTNGNLNRITGVQTRSSRSITNNSNVVKKRKPTIRKSSIKILKRKTFALVDQNNSPIGSSTSAEGSRIVNNGDTLVDSPAQLFIDDSSNNNTDVMETGQMDFSHELMQQNHSSDTIPSIGDTRIIMQDSDSLLMTNAADNKLTDAVVIMNSTQQQTPYFSSFDEYRIRRSLEEALKSTDEIANVSPLPSPNAPRDDTHRHHSERHSVKWNLSSASQHVKRRNFLQTTRPISTQPTPGTTSSSIVRTTVPTILSTNVSAASVNPDLSRRRNSIRSIPLVPITHVNIRPAIQSSNASQISRSSITRDHSRKIKDKPSIQTAASEMERNLALLQSLPEFRALQRQIKVLQKRIKQWSHDYSVLENKYHELQANSFPRPSSDGYEFIRQLLEAINQGQPDDDPRTEIDLACDLNMTHDKLISLQHGNPQRTALNILHALFPTNTDKAGLLGIRQMNAIHGDKLQTIYVFARRMAPGTCFSMRQMRHAFGMAIRQARYRLNSSNTTIVKLGSAVATGKPRNKGNEPCASTPSFDTFINDLEDFESCSSIEEENVE